MSGEPTGDDHLPSSEVSVLSMSCDRLSLHHLEEPSDGTELIYGHGNLYRKSILSVAGIVICPASSQPANYAPL